MDEVFTVEQYPTNDRWVAICDAIKDAEPALRAKGRAIDWDKFNQLFESGAFSNMEEAIKHL